MSKNATEQSTKSYFEKHKIHPDHLRRFADLYISSLGLGTYLGECDDQTDELYEKMIYKAISSGINSIDTAINYRCCRSEKVIQKALLNLNAAGIHRDQLMICTKGGFIPHEDVSISYEENIAKYYVDTKIIEPKEIAVDSHCMSPRFLASQIEKSLENLGIETLDLYYLHNPEVQLTQISEEEFYQKLDLAIEFLESMVQAGKISYYGFSTWNGFRQKRGTKGFLDLDKIIKRVIEIIGENHHFKAIQIPYNLICLEAAKLQNQLVNEHKATFLETAKALNIEVIVSAPLMQSQVLHLPSRFYDEMPPEGTFVQKALQFVLSTPNIAQAMLGMKTDTHAEENMAVLHQEVWEKDLKIWKLLGIEK